MVVWSGMKKNHPRVSKSFYDSFGLQTTCLHSHHDHLVWLAIIVSSNGRKNTFPNMSAFFTWACFRYVISLYSYSQHFCVTWPFVAWKELQYQSLWQVQFLNLHLGEISLTFHHHWRWPQPFGRYDLPRQMLKPCAKSLERPLLCCASVSQKPTNN